MTKVHYHILWFEYLCMKYNTIPVQVMMKSIKLEWCLGEIKNAHTLLQEAVKHYPDFAKVSINIHGDTCIEKGTEMTTRLI